MKKGVIALIYMLGIILIGCGANYQTNSKKEIAAIEKKTDTTTAVTTVASSSNVSQSINTEKRTEIIAETKAAEPAVTELASAYSSVADEPAAAPIPTNHRIQVKNIMQKPELPFGCEIVSLTIVLNHYGFDVDKMYMSENYLEKVPFWEKDGERYGADPYEAFPGDPADNVSSGCFASVITNSAKRFLSDNKSDYVAVNTSRMSLNELFHKYIDNDIPVIIWITSCDLHEIVYRHTWKTKDGQTVRFPSYQHCVVMTGYDTKKKIVYIADPLVGNTTYDMKLLKKRFKELGSESMVVEKRD